MSVYTLLGLVEKDTKLATVTDKRTGRIFEYAVIKLNLPAVTLEGGVEADTALPKQLLTVLQAPQTRGTKAWITSWSDEFRINAEFFAIREKRSDGKIGQSWAVRVGSVSKAQRNKLIAASGLSDPQKGPIIPRFLTEVGAGRNSAEALERRIVMRPAGLYFSSKPAKRKGKSL